MSLLLHSYQTLAILQKLIIPVRKSGPNTMNMSCKSLSKAFQTRELFVLTSCVSKSRVFLIPYQQCHGSIDQWDVEKRTEWKKTCFFTPCCFASFVRPLDLFDPDRLWPQNTKTFTERRLNTQRPIKVCISSSVLLKHTTGSAVQSARFLVLLTIVTFCKSWSGFWVSNQSFHEHLSIHKGKTHRSEWYWRMQLNGNSPFLQELWGPRFLV